MISKCLSFSTVYTELPLIKMRMDVEGTGLWENKLLDLHIGSLARA